MKRIIESWYIPQILLNVEMGLRIVKGLCKNDSLLCYFRFIIYINAYLIGYVIASLGKKLVINC